ncbi:glycosyltransferase [Arthrobacter psychrochitiniphilus]|uniref:4,4'-diaponeurosporenoate glycosyltransferase n=1 Tax=Arthrobacter psychrochitiniphilus TaxID=291045 RepID=A0A2V3DN35_9MICC|nr:glycosyltransferase family 2 protein [Arthrobacter psychrochitiniphilus]NYG18539.1 glycosyltransferase involved in cell wall biosynthesis [Arthrobacter psychrochitiniphilus]PXA64350.1 glycosyl transferase family 2 [Arthrobacter psychrochitiniphilus]
MNIESQPEAKAQDVVFGPPRQEPRPRVSVVIPVKDDSLLLARCLAALHSQSIKANEIIVVDNGSIDDSALTARLAGATLISCSEPGIPAASSRGYDFASGDLILRLDADCVPPTSWIEDVVTAFADSPQTSALTGTARFIDGPAFLRTPLAVLYLTVYWLAAMPALGHRPLFGSNLAMRREAWESVSSSAHRRDCELHDDFDLSFHLGEHHRVRYLRSAAMGMSMRPFKSAREFLRRTHRGFRTVLIHWPHDFPPRRWRRLASARSRRAGSNAGAFQ